MSYKIDLGRKPRDLMMMVGPDNGDRTHYPSLHIDDNEDPEVGDIPDTGECVIKYKVTDRTESERTINGKKRKSCSLTLEVHSIEPTSGQKYKKKNGNGYGDDARKAVKDYFKDK